MVRAAFACVLSVMGLAAPLCAKEWPGFSKGMGIGGWLTNYKRFNVLPQEKRLCLTRGDFAHFRTYITEGDVARIKKWGFDHVRLGFDQLVVEEAPGRYREETLAHIVRFVSWCRRHRLNVVLNMHKAIGNYCDIPEKVQLLDDEALQDRFVAVWLEVERRLHDAPEVAFELLNEVRRVDPEKWNALADRTIRALRKRNPSRWIVVGSTLYNSPKTLKDLRIWEDPRIVYTFHVYDPFHFTHQRGVLQSGPLYENAQVAYPGRAVVEKVLEPACEWAAAHPDKILWNGEFGTIRHISPMARADYMRDVIAVCRKAGMPYCVWNYLSTPNDGNRFSLVDDVTRDFLTDDLQRACLGLDTREETRTLRYMTFNIWGDYFGNPVWERDLKTAAYVVRQAPDVVGFQEVTPRFWQSRLFAELGKAYGVIRAADDDKASYNPLLWRKSRLDLVDGGTHVFAAADNPEGSKGFSWGVFRDKSSKKMFISYSAHLWWKKGEAADAMRVNNVREMLGKLAALQAKYGCPVVGGGDLNSTRLAADAQAVSPLNTLAEAGYANAQYALEGASAYSSHHGDPKRDALGNYRGWIAPQAADPKNSLDHVHYTPRGISPLSLFVDRAQDALEVSDHSPVLFTFRLGERP